MKTRRNHAKRIVTAALLTILAAAAVAQGPGGPPPGGRGGPGPMGGPGGRPPLDRLPSAAMMVMRPEVADELALTADQRDQIHALVESTRPSRPHEGDGPPDFRTMRAAREKAEAASDAKLKTILSAAQATRLGEIQIQTMGLSAALVPSIQTKLGLSEDQKVALRALVPARPEDRPAGPPPGGPDGPPPGEPGRPEGQGRGPRGPRGSDPRRAELEAKIASILTLDQKSALKALGGKPFLSRLGPRPGG